MLRILNVVKQREQRTATCQGGGPVRFLRKNRQVSPVFAPFSRENLQVPPPGRFPDSHMEAVEGAPWCTVRPGRPY